MKGELNEMQNRDFQVCIGNLAGKIIQVLYSDYLNNWVKQGWFLTQKMPAYPVR